MLSQRLFNQYNKVYSVANLLFDYELHGTTYVINSGNVVDIKTNNINQRKGELEMANIKKFLEKEIENKRTLVNVKTGAVLDYETVKGYTEKSFRMAMKDNSIPVTKSYADYEMVHITNDYIHLETIIDFLATQGIKLDMTPAPAEPEEN